MIKRLFAIGMPQDRNDPTGPARAHGTGRNPDGADTYSISPSAPPIIKEHDTRQEAEAEVALWRDSGFSASVTGPFTVGGRTFYTSVASVGGD